jgi:hypothetical protein
MADPQELHSLSSLNLLRPKRQSITSTELTLKVEALRSTCLAISQLPETLVDKEEEQGAKEETHQLFS